MGIVVPIGGITRLDLPADQVLEGAVGKMESVVIIGYAKDGTEYFASTLADGADVLWLLERCKHSLMMIVEED